MYSEILLTRVRANTIKQLKKMNIFNENVMLEVLFNPIETAEQVQATYDLVESLKPPFEIPDETVDGPIRFALTEDNHPVGMHPHECHTLIAGQTRTGKSTLLKILFAQALCMNGDNE